MTGRFRLGKEIPLHIMLIPGIVFVLIFSYIPMTGILMAFEDYIPGKGWYVFGHKWVGLEHFRFMFSYDLFRIVRNTVYIAGLKIVTGLAVPITLSLMLNEVRKAWYRRAVQTLLYLPNFLSWVILGGILIDILSPQKGILATMLKFVGIDPPFFMADNKWFPWVLVLSHLWKEAGFATIIYLAAITSIDMAQYEAAIVDGAGKIKQLIHITIPGMLPVIVLMGVLSLGSILNAGFEQVFNLYSPAVYQSGDILDTFIYRLGLKNMQYGLSAAVGVLKSLVSFIFISVSYFLAYKIADYRLF